MNENILNQLAVPFYSAAVEWKPQVISADKTRALAAAYVDMREYEDRLDQVFPDWSSSVQFLLSEKKVAAVVSLTIDGVTRVNVGESPLDDPNAFTTAYAQGFKRACSDFGLGRYLYRLPQVWCDYDEKRRAIIGAPELPGWARQPDEGQGLLAREPSLHINQRATQRVAAEETEPETETEPYPVPAPAPVPQPEAQVQGDIGDFIVPESFKKHAGLKLRNIPRSSIEWYAQMDARTPPARALQAAARAFLARHPA